MDGMSAVSTAIVTTLNADMNLSTYKVYQNAAPPATVPPTVPATSVPYILFSHSAGGLENDAPYDSAEVDMLITVVSVSATEAKNIFAYVEAALRNKTLSYPDGWHAWSTVREMEYYSRSNTVQNNEYPQVGAYFRFRLSRGK